MNTADPYLQAFSGGFSGILRWSDLDALWAQLRLQPEGWYLYAVGEAPPTLPLTGAQCLAFIEHINLLLREEHEADYCGIVYVDDRSQPGFIKIYDPNNLGVSCGISTARILPGWILSHLPPIDLPAALLPPAGRRRWWQRFWHKTA